MKKMIFLTVALLVIGPASTLAHNGIDDSQLIIKMTNNGFEPKELTLSQGDEVTFMNDDDVKRWPASDFHPTHEIYPEFDTKTGISPGESWKMRFEKPGTWRLHDHLIPHMKGTIVVIEDPNAVTQGEEVGQETEEKASSPGWLEKIKAFFLRLFRNPSGATSVDQKLLGEFRKQDEQGKYAWLKEISRKESPETAWQYVVSAYSAPPEGISGSAHDMAHLVGQLIFEKYDFDGLSICTPVFAFGCYHGLMESAFDKDNHSIYLEKLAEAKQACDKVPEKVYKSCIHGIGHGVASFREYDLNQSLSDCDSLEEKTHPFCHDGVFMEFANNAPENFYKKNNPVYPCDAIDSKYQAGCARSIPNVMRFRMKMSFAETALACQGSRAGRIIYHCIDALGYLIGQTSKGDKMKVLKDCRTISDENLASQCLSAGAGELVFQNFPNWQESVKTICEEQRTDEGKIDCYKRVEDSKKDYGTN